TGVTQTGRQLKVTGSFSSPNESQLLMTLQFPTGSTTFVPAKNDENGATFNLGDLAAGTYTVTWSMSCDSGDNVDVSGPSKVTITN
ncbi:MAG: hypothetical protein ACREK8_03775, partial [Gemmatimonadales bacterium]